MINPPPSTFLKKRFIIAAIVCGITALGYVFSLYTIDRIINKDTLVPESKEGEIKLAKNALIFKEVSPSMPKIDQRFAHEGEDVSILESVEVLAEEDFDLFEILKIEPVGKSLQITATAEGSWNDVISFIAKQEILPYVHKIKKISFIMVKTGTSSIPTWNTGMVLEVPFFPK